LMTLLINLQNTGTQYSTHKIFYTSYELVYPYASIGHNVVNQNQCLS